MKTTTRRKGIMIVILILLALAGLAAGYLVYSGGRPAPIPVKRQISPGVTYRRIVKYVPHPMIVHVLALDRRTKGMRLFVTPPDQSEGPPLLARTTSEFLSDFHLQIAINGDGFHPWWSNSPVDYYPHSGDPVTPNGFAASGGKVYSRGGEGPPAPTMYISRGGEISFNRIPSRVQHALSGDRMIVLKGEPVPDLEAGEAEPRTAIGINQNGRWMYVVVVDGRQPFYSEGATFTQLAGILVDLGAHTAMNLDGGGSSTMVIAGEDGAPIVLNSPVDQYIPGRERPVANHLGVYLDE